MFLHFNLAGLHWPVTATKQQPVLYLPSGRDVNKPRRVQPSFWHIWSNIAEKPVKLSPKASTDNGRGGGGGSRPGQEGLHLKYMDVSWGALLNWVCTLCVVHLTTEKADVCSNASKWNANNNSNTALSLIPFRLIHTLSSLTSQLRNLSIHSCTHRSDLHNTKYTNCSSCELQSFSFV